MPCCPVDVDLSRLTRVQFDQLAGAIMTRYDAGSAGSMSFEDFYTFFAEFLATPDHMLQLRVGTVHRPLVYAVAVYAVAHVGLLCSIGSRSSS